MISIKYFVPVDCILEFGIKYHDDNDIVNLKKSQLFHDSVASIISTTTMIFNEMK